MPVYPRRFLIALVVLAASLALAACQLAAGGQPAAVPPAAQPNPGQVEYPAPGTGNVPTAYPVPQTEGENTLSGDVYPAPKEGDGPITAPAVENRAQITAKLIDMAPDAEVAGDTRLHVLVLSSNDVAGMPNMTRQVVNQEINLLVETAKLPDLKPGDQIEANVTYRGDEHGGTYFALDLKKKE